MTNDEIKARAIRAGEMALEQIRDTGNMMPHLWLFNSPTQGDTFIAMDGDMMNDKGAKIGLAEFVRGKVAEGGYRSVLFVSDTWDLGKMDEAAMAKINELRAQGITSFPEIAKRGVGELREHIRVMVQGDYNLMAQWRYYRDKDGNVERFDPVTVEGDMGLWGGIFDFYRTGSTQ